MLTSNTYFQENNLNSSNLITSDADTNPNSWKVYPATQQVTFCNSKMLQKVLALLQKNKALIQFNCLLTLKRNLEAASAGKIFVLQTGDCAEQFKDCTKDIIKQKVEEYQQQRKYLEKILLKDVLVIGRIAGQFAKPRSEDFEKVNGSDLPIYRGDIINRQETNAVARHPQPVNLIKAYKNARKAFNYINMFTKNKKIYTSHEALLLNYESCFTKYHQEHKQYYNANAHFLWIGERTRQLDHAHIEYIKHLFNPVGIKISSKISPAELVKLIEKINPNQEKGKIVIIPRLGINAVEDYLPKFIQAIKKNNIPVTWLCDPMHGNTEKTSSGIKTRKIENIIAEVKITKEIHLKEESILGGIHLETSHADVTECYGGLNNILVNDIAKNYQTACDPRLNPTQTREVLKTFLNIH